MNMPFFSFDATTRASVHTEHQIQGVDSTPKSPMIPHERAF
jgi:hypothetical protein